MVFKSIRNRIFGVIIYFILFISTIIGQGSQVILQDTFPEYSFIRYEQNTIIGDSILAPLFTKLRSQETGEHHQLRIAHLGDSHVQADLFPGMLRALLQQRFGNAGRGLAFFYEQAGTHSPLDLKTKSSNNWENRRRIFQKNAPPIGISGMSIATKDPQFEIHLFQQALFGFPYPFDQVTLFHNEKNSGYEYKVQYQGLEALITTPPSSPAWSLYTVKAGDTLFDLAKRYKTSTQDLSTWNQLKGDAIFVGQQLNIKKPPEEETGKNLLKLIPTGNGATSQVKLPQVANALTLYGSQGKAGNSAILYGLLLENTRASGILYNMMGVNGATFYHFNHAEHFKEQLVLLKPDLILVTLGTNEAIQSKFYPDQVRKEVRQFLKTIKEDLPEAKILFTINPDVLTKKRYATPNSEQVRTIIIAAAKEFGAAYWDLYTIMGGLESIRSWREEELAYRDFIHFTKKGYILHAHLLYQALMKCYAASY